MPPIFAVLDADEMPPPYQVRERRYGNALRSMRAKLVLLTIIMWLIVFFHTLPQPTNTSLLTFGKPTCTYTCTWKTTNAQGPLLARMPGFVRGFWN
ncbi:hypothetical protein P171DRAFT_492021 [Karstenula rhodostoma CBS 690.94]|uniref:Uncharacterized protein n=1 Tax=Karstenula rhodostoma CBS 690.94 TaxID=1392251 RepID=A0A9P4U626_9PLEO|nr:hypothetical protein P171DRAFT_492021 [Karstenula rhodostoma CBS 690.94]